MTSDRVQHTELKMSSTIRPFNAMQADSGLELTRMQNFLEGQHDIFDVLEEHKANKNMPSLYDRVATKMNHSHKPEQENRNFWSRLKSKVFNFVL